MEKRYQVFVSSTFLDLREERSKVIQSLLELNCIPSGMELFPADDDDQWTFIRDAIDDCDYYIVIVAGRYGSISTQTNKSFTQMEYEYALEKGKPIIGFLHSDPTSLANNLCEQSAANRELLNDFRGLVGSKLCRYWSNGDQLRAEVTLSMVSLIKRKPGIGWVRADMVGDESSAQEIARLRRRIEELEQHTKETINASTLGINVSELEQGNDKVHVRFSYIETYYSGGYDDPRSSEDGADTLDLTWNQIFLTISPQINGCITEGKLRTLVTNLIFKYRPEFFTDQYNDVAIDEDDFQTIKIQLFLLNLIESVPIEGSDSQWKLSSHGEMYMLRARAVKRALPVQEN